MTEAIVEFFSSITNNDYLTLFMISIIPIIELRGAIVIMSGMTGINELLGMLCCVAGSTVVIVPLLLFFRPLIKSLKRSKYFKKFAKNMEQKMSEKAESVHTDQTVSADGKTKKTMSVNLKKFLGTFIFVAIPLPMTGAWTGSCVASFVNFGVWRPAIAVFLGNIVAGLILTGIAIVMPQEYVDMFLYGFVVLAIALGVSAYFATQKKRDKKMKEAVKEYGNKNAYELALLEQEANEEGKILIKKEYIDENGDKHIVIGNKSERNEKYADDDNLI